MIIITNIYILAMVYERNFAGKLFLDVTISIFSILIFQLLKLPDISELYKSNLPWPEKIQYICKKDSLKLCSAAENDCDPIEIEY